MRTHRPNLIRFNTNPITDVSHTRRALESPRDSIQRTSMSGESELPEGQNPYFLGDRAVNALLQVPFEYFLDVVEEENAKFQRGEGSILRDWDRAGGQEDISGQEDEEEGDDDDDGELIHIVPKKQRDSFPKPRVTASHQRRPKSQGESRAKRMQAAVGEPEQEDMSRIAGSLSEGYWTKLGKGTKNSVAWSVETVISQKASSSFHEGGAEDNEDRDAGAGSVAPYRFGFSSYGFANHPYRRDEIARRDLKGKNS